MTEYTFKNFKDGYVTDEQGFTNEVTDFLIQYYNIPTDNLPKDTNGNVHIPCYTSKSPEIMKLTLEPRNELGVTHPLYEAYKSMTDEEYMWFLDNAFLESNFILDLGSLFVTFGEGMEEPLVYGELSYGLYCFVNNIPSNNEIPNRIRAFYTRLGKEALKKGLNLKESISSRSAMELFDNTITPGLLKYTLACYEEIRRGLYDDEDNENEHYIGELTGIICAKSAKKDKELFAKQFKNIEEKYINPAQEALNASLDTHLPKDTLEITKELTLAIISDAIKRFENI